MRKIRNIYKTIAWAVIIFVLSSLSGNQLDKLPFLGIPHIDKVGHMGIYFILALLLISSISNMKNSLKIFIAGLLAFTIAAIYGGIIELLQQYVFIKRSMDLYDFLANCTGALIAVLLYPVIKKRNWIA
ncbi:MAG: VanZ family protein [Bacteroidota bacterium]